MIKEKNKKKKANTETQKGFYNLSKGASSHECNSICFIARLAYILFMDTITTLKLYTYMYVLSKLSKTQEFKFTFKSEGS